MYNVDEMTHGFLKILVDIIRTFITLHIYNVNNNVIKAKLIQKILSTSLWNIGLLYLLRSLNTCNRTSFLEPLKVKKSQKQI